MSRGMGRIERGVVDELAASPDSLDVFVLARRVYGVAAESAAQVVSVRRALSSLVAKRVIDDPGRLWRDGRKRWTHPRHSLPSADDLRAMRRVFRDSQNSHPLRNL